MPEYNIDRFPQSDEDKGLLCLSSLSHRLSSSLFASNPNLQNVCILFASVLYAVGGSAPSCAGRGKGIILSQTIFVLEDDVDIARLMQHHLEAAGFSARIYSTPAAVIPDAERQAPVLFLLDIMVPGGDGLDVCRRLRNHPALSTVPIIFVTARAAENDRVLGLELGADDYVTKPFAPRELLARVKAVLRRFERPSTPSVIVFDEIEVDASAMQLKVKGELTTTTATEFRLLDYLARHPGRVFSRDHLLDAVWGDARFVTPRSVDVYVRRIREKIEQDPENPRYLKTVRGAGYRFEIPKTAERAVS
jgi:two-component system phosphate regulon response regulator PhoB